MARPERPARREDQDLMAQSEFHPQMLPPQDLLEEPDSLVLQVFQGRLVRLEQVEHRAIQALRVFQEIQVPMALLEILERQVCIPLDFLPTCLFDVKKLEKDTYTSIGHSNFICC